MYMETACTKYHSSVGEPVHSVSSSEAADWSSVHQLDKDALYSFKHTLTCFVCVLCICAGGVVPNKDDVPKKRPFYGKKKTTKDQHKGEPALWCLSRGRDVEFQDEEFYQHFDRLYLVWVFDVWVEVGMWSFKMKSFTSILTDCILSGCLMFESG